jgi:hypothetical protein
MIDITAPVGGLNYLASFELMQPTDARILDNWIPDTGFCRIRESGTEEADLSAEFE